MAFEKKIGKATLELALEDAGFQRSIQRIRREGFGGLKAEVESFARRHRESFLAIGALAAGAVAGIGAVTAAVVSLGQRGAVVGDVRDQFDALSRSVGSTGAAMLGALQRGTVGSIRNFDLMRMANSALGSGLIRTAQDMEALAGGARLLAKRTGGDTAEAFDTLTSAIASGRTATLKQLGLFVDSKVAIEAYAKSHKMAAADMTDADRAAALQAATIAELRKQFAVTALDAADFGERIDQLKVRWQNFTDDLAVAISLSPVLNEALGSISDGIARAFGDDQSARIQRLVGLTNSFVMALVEAGRMAVTVADIIRRAWGGLEAVFASVMTVMTATGMTWAKMQATALELAAKLPLVGKEFQNIAWQSRDAANQLEGMAQSWRQQTLEAVNAVRGQSAVHDALGRVSTSLGDLRQRLTLVASHQTTAATTAAAHTQQLNQNTEATRRNTAATTANADAKARQDAAYRQFINFVEERRIEDAKAANARVQAATDAQLEELDNERRVQQQIQDEHERSEADWRAYQNMLGERAMEDEAARLQQLRDLRERALQPYRDLYNRVVGAATSNLFSLVTGIGAGVDDALTKQAEAARADFERIKNSGTASAEEITRAYRAMLDAQDAANSGFSKRFKSWLSGIGHEFTSWINDMVAQWTRNFIGGLLRSLAQSAIGQRLMGWIGKLIPGVGGGTGGGRGGDIASAAAGWLGLGAGGASTAAGISMFSGFGGTVAAGTYQGSSLMALATTPTVVSQGVSGTVAGTAAGGTGGGMGATIGALATNPITIAAAGVLALYASGLLNGGAGANNRLEAWRRGDPAENPRLGRMTREQFLALDSRSGSRESLLRARLAPPPPLATPQIDRALQMPDVRPASGAMTAPSVRPAGDSAGASTSRTVNLYATIHALDGADVERIWRERLVPKLKLALKTGQDGVDSAIRDAALS